MFVTPGIIDHPTEIKPKDFRGMPELRAFDDLIDFIERNPAEKIVRLIIKPESIKIVYQTSFGIYRDFHTEVNIIPFLYLSNLITDYFKINEPIIELKITTMFYKVIAVTTTMVYSVHNDTLLIVDRARDIAKRMPIPENKDYENFRMAIGKLISFQNDRAPVPQYSRL